ncbi:MAG: EamA family transporter [Deltaproteobacteria bacterium]|nr:EamA family transporter [Deltaproteobacteria bacterium]
MNISVLFAIASMFSAGLNDLLFKQYVSKDRRKGVYIALIGLVWSCFYLVRGTLSGGIHFDNTTLLYGLVSGGVLLAANIFLLEGFRGVDASVGSTIYRLNFMVVIVLAPIFLAEQLTLWKVAGLVFAATSVFLMSWSQDSNQGTKNQTLSWFIILVIMASIFRRLMGFFYKVGAMHGVDYNSFLLINAFFWLICGPIYSVITEKDLAINKSIILYGIASGLVVVGITSLLLLSLKYGEAIVAVPIAQLNFVLTMVLSVVPLKKRVTPYKLLGIICAVGAIVPLAFASLH